MTRTVLDNLNIKALNEMQIESLKAEVTRDIILLSPTGSGKTVGFLLPLLNLLKADTSAIQALILVPSRELGLQIEQVFKSMQTGFKVNCCYGGHSTKTEKNNFKHPPAVLIGTPGRISYHLRNENFDPIPIHTLVLDEFDKALEFGFETDMSFIIRQLAGLKKRILTSASKMEKIPDFTGINNPVEIDFLKDGRISPDLKIKIVISPAADKLDTLFSLICKIGNKPSLIFCNHREAVERISDLLWEKGLKHDIFHGGMEQEDRERALLKFRNGSHHILITTDLASRGLDIPEIENIIHYQMPHNEKAFLHRNGRTARMNATGTSFLILTPEEKPSYLQSDTETIEFNEPDILPGKSDWVTLYIAAGKKDKINKVDIVGLLLKKGGLVKDELGLIEVLDSTSYAAVRGSKIENLVALLKDEKIKNKKIKIEISR